MNPQINPQAQYVEPLSTASRIQKAPVTDNNRTHTSSYVGRMLPEDIQTSNERSFSRKLIKQKLRDELLENEDAVAKIDAGVELVQAYLDKPYERAINQQRIDQLKHGALDIREMVITLFVATMFCQSPEKFVSVTSQLSGTLGLSDKLDGIRTMAELMAVLCATDAYDLVKDDKYDEIKVQSRLPVSDKLKVFVMRSRFLPPMVTPPNWITRNNQSGYLTENGSLILKDNYHNDPLALDTINTQNQVPLCLNRELIEELRETPSKAPKNAYAQQQFVRLANESLEFYAMLIAQSDVLYLTHRYDKRGRMYASGYHISTQGSPYKKAVLDFARQEPIEVPEEFRA